MLSLKISVIFSLIFPNRCTCYICCNIGPGDFGLFDFQAEFKQQTDDAHVLGCTVGLPRFHLLPQNNLQFEWLINLP